MTRHILQDQTYLEVQEDGQVAVVQGTQFITMPSEKWLEVYLVVSNMPRPNVPIPRFYPKGDE